MAMPIAVGESFYSQCSPPRYCSMKLKKYALGMPQEINCLLGLPGFSFPSQNLIYPRLQSPNLNFTSVQYNLAAILILGCRGRYFKQAIYRLVNPSGGLDHPKISAVSLPVSVWTKPRSKTKVLNHSSSALILTPYQFTMDLDAPYEALGTGGWRLQYNYQFHESHRNVAFLS